MFQKKGVGTRRTCKVIVIVISALKKSIIDDQIAEMGSLNFTALELS